MNRQQYDDLIHQFCMHVGLDPVQFNETNMLSVNGLKMLLFYDDELRDDQMAVRVDFGTLSQVDVADLYRVLLHSNFIVGLNGNGVFSLSPEQEHIVFTLQMPLLQMKSGEDVAKVLHEYAVHASNIWAELQEAVAHSFNSQDVSNAE